MTKTNKFNNFDINNIIKYNAFANPNQNSNQRQKQSFIRPKQKEKRVEICRNCSMQITFNDNKRSYKGNLIPLDIYGNPHKCMKNPRKDFTHEMLYHA